MRTNFFSLAIAFVLGWFTSAVYYVVTSPNYKQGSAALPQFTCDCNEYISNPIAPNVLKDDLDVVHKQKTEVLIVVLFESFIFSILTKIDQQIFNIYLPTRRKLARETWIPKLNSKTTRYFFAVMERSDIETVSQTKKNFQNSDQKKKEIGK